MKPFEEREINVRWIDVKCKCGNAHSEHYRTEPRPGFELA
jgi:hypothetical protein